MCEADLSTLWRPWSEGRPEGEYTPVLQDSCRHSAMEDTGRRHCPKMEDPDEVDGGLRIKEEPMSPSICTGIMNDPTSARNNPHESSHINSPTEYQYGASYSFSPADIKPSIIDNSNLHTSPSTTHRDVHQVKDSLDTKPSNYIQSSHSTDTKIITPPVSVHPSKHPYQQFFLEAVEKGDHSEVERLLHHGGLNVNVMDTDGQTALHRGCSDGNLEVVKLLLKFGADVRLCNRDGWSALHMACWGGHQQVVLYLLNAYKAGTSSR